MNNNSSKDYISWHYDPNDKPEDKSVCFLDINGNLEVGIWYKDYYAWKNTLAGWIIEDIDGKIKKWSYVPKKILNYLNPICGCYLNVDGGRCLGTKEIDSCNCSGNRSFCDYY